MSTILTADGHPINLGEIYYFIDAYRSIVSVKVRGLQVRKNNYAIQLEDSESFYRPSQLFHSYKAIAEFQKNNYNLPDKWSFILNNADYIQIHGPPHIKIRVVSNENGWTIPYITIDNVVLLGNDITYHIRLCQTAEKIIANNLMKELGDGCVQPS